MRQIFKHEGERFLYDLDVLPMKAYRRAFSIYQYQNQILRQPPGTWREFDASGAADADDRAFSYLLMELDEEGDPRPYGVKSVEAASKFLEVVPASYRKEMEECREHFFNEAELVNIVSLQQLGALYGASTNGAVAARLLEQAMRNQEIDETSLTDESESESSSTSPESSTDDSSSATRTAPITTGPTDSSVNPPPGKSNASD